MVELRFECVEGRAERYAASPTLALRIRLAEATRQPIHTLALRCQIRIQPTRRRYRPTEADRLLDLFGETSRWGDTLKPLQFATVSHQVPGFTGQTEFDLAVPCTYDFEVASTKYFHALEDGEIPLLLLFSGTVFARTPGGFAVEPVPWDNEASYRLPVAVWRELMDLYFPNSAWLRLRRDTLDALQLFKSRQALATWDEALGVLLKQAGEATPEAGEATP